MQAAEPARRVGESPESSSWVGSEDPFGPLLLKLLISVMAAATREAKVMNWPFAGSSAVTSSCRFLHRTAIRQVADDHYFLGSPQNSSHRMQPYFSCAGLPRLGKGLLSHHRVLGSHSELPWRPSTPGTRRSHVHNVWKPLTPVWAQLPAMMKPWSHHAENVRLSH